MAMPYPIQRMHEMLLMLRSAGMVFIVMPNNTNADAAHPSIFITLRALGAWQVTIAFPIVQHIG